MTDLFGPAKLAILQPDGSYVILDVRLNRVQKHTEYDPSGYGPILDKVTFSGEAFYQDDSNSSSETDRLRRELDAVHPLALKGSDV